MQIDLEPRRHSHLYEIKPMSRWWFVLVIGLLLLQIVVNGFFSPYSWGIALFGTFTGMALLLCFPKHWLSKLDD